MARSEDDCVALVGSLATIAIASLGGPLSIVSTALSEVVKHAQAAYLSDAPARDAQRQITSEVMMWATAETFGADDTRLGLALASEVVATFGLGYDGIAELNFDPAEASKQVLAPARSRSRFWGTEAHYAVAERAVEVTYESLIRALRRSEGPLIASVQVLRKRIDAVEAAAEADSRRIELSLQDLGLALIAASSTAEVMEYLRTRMEDWDVPRWSSVHRASDLERRVTLRTVDEDMTEELELPAERALAERRMLVVLGGPGSGKTWLARRFAREAAAAALIQLARGTKLREVEIPLLTTWDQWAKASGPPRESLVAAAFQSGLGVREVLAGGVHDRLRRSLLETGQRMLVVVDSLDEAADLSGQAARLYELTSLPWCRVVVTSRHSAWDAVNRGILDGTEAEVLELGNLRYPEEVHGFIQDWFADDPELGERLIKQIHNRADLRRTAVIPLMLTFYCLLGGDQPLPARRRELYQRLVRRLLRSEWMDSPPGADAAPDREYCETLLASWAWHAVSENHTIAGLGDWGDSFAQPTTPRERERRAIDNVAPKIAFDAEGEVVRRFLHRTILEHFVAEHISTVAADEAADRLLPHLWFDPDWKVTAPAAIAAHNQRDKGALLADLLVRTEHPATDRPRRHAAHEVDRLLVDVAVESDPHEWTEAQERRIHRSRVLQVTRNPDAVARSAHWRSSNAEARKVLLGAIHQASTPAARDLLQALPALLTTETAKAEARSALLASLTDARHGVPRLLLAALLPLISTDVDRVAVRSAVLNALRTTRSTDVRHLLDVLPLLIVTDADRAESRAFVIAALPTASGRTARLLASCLPALVNTDEDKAEAREALLSALPSATSKAVSGFLSALPLLVTTDEHRREALRAVLAAITAPEPRAIRRLAAALPTLATTEADRTETRAALLDAMVSASSGSIRYLAAALVRLLPSPAEVQTARAAVLASLPRPGQHGDPNEISGSVAVLWELEPTPDDRANARGVVIEALRHAKPGSVQGLLAALRRLDSQGNFELVGAPSTSATDKDRQQNANEFHAYQPEVRAAVLASLSTGHRGSVRGLPATLSRLNATDEERVEARKAVLAALQTANPRALSTLLAAVQNLIASDAERSESCSAVRIALRSATDAVALRVLSAALPSLIVNERDRTGSIDDVLYAIAHVRPSAVGGVAAALPSLVATIDERRAARDAVLGLLPVAPRGALRGVMAALPALVITDRERFEARRSALNALTGADPGVVSMLIEVLVALQPVESDLVAARLAVLAALEDASAWAIDELVAALRLVSPLNYWVAWLSGSDEHTLLTRHPDGGA